MAELIVDVETPTGEVLAIDDPAMIPTHVAGAEGEHENIRVVEMPLAELAARADSAEIADLKTLALILALRARHPELFAP